jgi:raffinose/stachyose/melibiose transport system permease protein
MSRPTTGNSRRAGFAATLVLWGYALVAIGPLLVVLNGSLRPNSELLADPLGLATSPTMANFERAWTTASFSAYLANSVVVTLASVVLATVVSAMVAYPLARWRFAGRGLLAAFFLTGLMLPIRLAVLPLFYLFERLALIDSRLGLILLYAATGIPFSVFVLMAFLRTLPVELEEAATIDGAGELVTFTRIVVPLIRPALATVAVFQLAPTWNDFFLPLVLLRTSGKYTLPVGLTQFFGEFATDRGALFAGLVLAVLPLVVVFAVGSRQIVAGLTSGLGR